MRQNGYDRRFNHLATISLLFIVVKVTHVCIITMTPAQFDVSSSILLASYLHQKEALSTFSTPFATLNSLLQKAACFFLDRFFDRLVTWDAVYFADLFANGIRYEHQFVFCPLWWRLIRAIPVNPETRFYSLLLWATLIANVCHYMAAVVLYFYTLAVFEKARIFSPTRMAVAASALYVLSPAAAFLTAPYSESIAALCAFLCLFAREISVGQPSLEVSQPRTATGNGARVSDSHPDREPETRPKHRLNAVSCLYVSSGVFAALAFGFRANCLFLGLVYVYDLYYKRTKSALLPLATGSILGAAFAGAQLHSYFVVCSSGRGEWCHWKVPSLFAYSQSHYWGNGLFRYWTANNAPNFAFAAPTVLLSVFASRYFAQTYPVERIMPVLAVNVVFLGSLLLFWHVQIVTRIHTFLPVVYWLVAGLLTQPNLQGQKWARVCVGYFVVWGVLQVSLFAAFLPPA